MMTIYRSAWIGVAVCAALVLSGCASDSSDSADDTVTEREIAESLFGLLQEAPQLDTTLLANFVVAGSAAEREILSLDERLKRGHIEGIFDRSDLTLDPVLIRSPETDELILADLSLCFEKPDFPEASPEDFCFIFSNFAFDEGLVVDFDVAGDAVHGQVLLKYFTAISSGQPSTVLGAGEYTVANSMAETYAIQQSHVRQADVDTGSLDFYPYEVTLEDGVVFIDYATPFSDFVFDDDKLVNFKAGDNFLDGRLVIYDEEPVPVGREASVMLLSAYQSVAGTLYITVEITAGDKTLQVPYSATYIPQDGRAMDEGLAVVPFELKDERVSNAYWAFASSPIGGELKLVFYDDRWNEIAVTVPVP